MLPLMFAAVALGAPVPVEVVLHDGAWSLVRDGQPYRIRGAGGDRDLELLAAIGGNSIRTWGVGDETAALLDAAQALDLTVSVGLWLGHPRHGFDYADAGQVAAQLAEVRAAVEAYRDHPAVLLWGLGNEMEGFEGGDDPAMWAAVCEAARAIRELDPHHPVMTTTADIGGGRIAGVDRCDAIAIHGVNSYGGAPSVPERYAASGGRKPVVVTEYGPPGTWEIGRTAFGAAPEATSTEKASSYRHIASTVLRHPSVLGGYAFLWGSKVEATATWYGLFLSDGTRLGGVDALADVWGRAVPDRAPVVTPLVASPGDQVRPGEIVQIRWTVTDPEGLPAVTEWSLRREVSSYFTGGDAQATPLEMRGAVQRPGVDGATVRMPKSPGVYRVYAVARDEQGGGATASLPLLVGELPKPGDPAPMPWPVTSGGDEGGPWVPSGWMGDTEALQVDPEWARDCASPPHCVRIRYTARGGWAGVAWQDPPNDWGDHDGGMDLSSARRLSVWVRGGMGAEVITLGVGLLGDDKAYPDTLRVERTVRLTTDWRRVRIPLRGDASRVKTGLWVGIAGQARPVTLFLDDVTFE